MEATRNAVEAYRRTLLISRVTMDDDKLAPVYQLDELCRVLSSSSLYMIQEMVEYTLKRLRHNSPLVKQKVLRLIKYTVRNAGPLYKKELQSHAAAIRVLCTFSGQLHPLKGDALNKAVRDAAHEAIAAIFAVDTRRSPMQDISKRIEGFGGSNFDILSKSMVYESADNERIESGTGERSGGLGYRKSFRAELEGLERPDTNSFAKGRVSSEVSDSKGRHFAYESDFCRRNENGDTQEDRLLDMITAPSELRLQPTRESLESFMSSARTLEPVKLADSLKKKMQSHSWQVRLRAICILEAILQQKNEDVFKAMITSSETDWEAIQGHVQDCLQSSQVTLKEKARKVLGLLLALHREHNSEAALISSMNDSKSITMVSEVSPTVNVTDLLDTTELGFRGGRENFLDASPEIPTGTTLIAGLYASACNLQGDRESLRAREALPDTVAEDPLAGMCIHANASVGILVPDLLSKEWISNQDMDGPVGESVNKQSTVFTSMNAQTAETAGQSTPLAFLESPNLTGKCENGFRVPKLSSLETSLQSKTNPVQFTRAIPRKQNVHSNHPFIIPVDLVGSFHLDAMMPQLYPSNTPLFNGVGDVLTQQQFLSRMAGLKDFGLGINQQIMCPVESFSNAYPDGFDFSSNPIPRAGIKETKAFDFISDHLQASLGMKKAK